MKKLDFSAKEDGSVYDRKKMQEARECLRNRGNDLMRRCMTPNISFKENWDMIIYPTLKKSLTDYQTCLIKNDYEERFEKLRILLPKNARDVKSVKSHITSISFWESISDEMLELPFISFIEKEHLKKALKLYKDSEYQSSRDKLFKVVGTRVIRAHKVINCLGEDNLVGKSSVKELIECYRSIYDDAIVGEYCDALNALNQRIMRQTEQRKFDGLPDPVNRNWSAHYVDIVGVTAIDASQVLLFCYNILLVANQIRTSVE